MDFRSLFVLCAFLLASTPVNAQQTAPVVGTKDAIQPNAATVKTASTLATVIVGSPLSSSASPASAIVVHDAAASASSDNGQYIDTNAGASGSSAGNSFNLSKGGLIAIIIVVVVVVIFGIASTVLFVLAKRRQWNIRASVARASRRLTGRFGGNKADALAQRRDRRTGIYAGGARIVSPPRVVAIKPPGHNRGLVVNVHDVEKGPLYSTQSADSAPTKPTWTNNLFGRK
nr:hypothetical protein CFP56_53655 [Quercus suber]